MPDWRISFQPHKQLKCWFLQDKMFCQVSQLLFLFSSVSLLKFRAGSKGLLFFASRLASFFTSELAHFISLSGTGSWVRMASHKNKHKINSLKCWWNSHGDANPTFSLNVFDSEESWHFHSRFMY